MPGIGGNEFPFSRAPPQPATLFANVGCCWMQLPLPAGGPTDIPPGPIGTGWDAFCSAAAAAASDCLPRNRRWCTNRVTIESTRLDSDAVISVLSTSASPSRSVPDMGPTELALERIMFSRFVKSDGMDDPFGIAGMLWPPIAAAWLVWGIACIGTNGCAPLKPPACSGWAALGSELCSLADIILLIICSMLEASAAAAAAAAVAAAFD
uniref:Uncharacterized protein n=1 Tax=Anopheles merus TaxID=30066 RepID=A0A182VBL6_ANOME